MGTGKYLKDTSILDTLQQFSSSISSLTAPEDVFLRLPPRKMNTRTPLLPPQEGFVFPFAVKDDRAVQSRPRLLTAYQINAKIPSPSALPSPSSNFTASR